MVYDFFPKLVVRDALKTSSENGCFEKLAQVELFASDLRHLEVVHAEIFLKLDQFFLKLFAFASFVLCVEELQLFGQSNVHFITIIHSFNNY